MPTTIDYLISSIHGNQVQIDEQDLENFQVLDQQDSDIRFAYKGKHYTASILQIDEARKNARIKMNNRVYELNLQDDLDQLVASMGMDLIENEAGGDIISPMPGMVLKVLVKEGDSVEQGDSILVLEAMKMENLLQASAAGIVTKVRCQAGDKVNKSDVLVEIQ